MNYTVNWLLFGLFLNACAFCLFAENRLRPRLFKTIYGDWILWFTWRGKRKFYIIFKA